MTSSCGRVRSGCRRAAASSAWARSSDLVTRWRGRAVGMHASVTPGDQVIQPVARHLSWPRHQLQQLLRVPPPERHRAGPRRHRGADGPLGRGAPHPQPLVGRRGDLPEQPGSSPWRPWQAGPPPAGDWSRDVRWRRFPLRARSASTAWTASEPRPGNRDRATGRHRQGSAGGRARAEGLPGGCEGRQAPGGCRTAGRRRFRGLGMDDAGRQPAAAVGRPGGSADRSGLGRAVHGHAPVPRRVPSSSSTAALASSTSTN